MIDIKIQPRCHFCNNPLTVGAFYNPFGITQYDCRSYTCPFKRVVDRCRVVYDPNISKLYFKSSRFWVIENDIWYQLDTEYGQSVKLFKTKIISRKNALPLQDGETQNLIDLKNDFKISIDDNLPDKVPKLLKRAKNLVIFS